MEVKPYEMP